MSFPPATEMFQFAGFASALPPIPLTRWVAPFGDLWINGCSPLPRAYRRVLRPSSPLGAKASTRCPYVRLRAFNPPCASTLLDKTTVSARRCRRMDDHSLIYTRSKPCRDRMSDVGCREELLDTDSPHPCFCKAKTRCCNPDNRTRRPDHETANPLHDCSEPTGCQMPDFRCRKDIEPTSNIP